MAWRLHPLMAELLRRGGGAEADVVRRATDWFVERLPEGKAGGEEDQGRRWREVQAEERTLEWWLPRVADGDRVRVVRAILARPTKSPRTSPSFS